jgi:hypothetical protein
MRTIVYVKNNRSIKIDENEFELKDFFLSLPNSEIYRADYVLECFYDYMNMPNRIRLNRKLKNGKLL